MALVPEEGLDGLAMGNKVFVETNGIDEDVFALGESATLGGHSLPYEQRVGRSVVNLYDDDAVA